MRESEILWDVSQFMRIIRQLQDMVRNYYRENQRLRERIARQTQIIVQLRALINNLN